ncbi:FkbM family methyltransferase [Algoriphagus zhangzhouensis]|uniref:Methyltransferase, FkbM family n=2 Tax=Algoriphagus zhangzhouensis TaxID=1073327 RepID=A0A1M7ZHU9_9BACT|nr:FkbM family methyltransferase [Algoriphagus zhangzhouensis]SHO64485.1 methyltransferase, FkbM family [Algoriphagus zhangzhouensis]
MIITNTLQKILKKFGLKIGKFPEPDKKRRLKIMRNFQINKVLDVGANTGSYGKELREMGYEGEIISFEPTDLAYSFLEKKCAKDSKWNCIQLALGDIDRTAHINISLNSKSSSLLEILPLSIENAPDSKFVGKEKVQVKALDQMQDELLSPGDHLMLKIDTQGYEKNILEGGRAILEKVKVVQLELSFEPLYRNEPTFFEMISYMEELGFEIFSLETDLSFSNPKNGKMLQVDCIFCKSSEN